MTKYLSVTEIVQLTECPSQYHFDKEAGAARSEELKRMAISGERAHKDYERALHSNPSPTAGDPDRKLGLIARLIRWILKLLFGRS